MRYMLETENNKLKKSGTGYSTGYYYVTGWDGSKGVMPKDWVVRNIGSISNASVSDGKQVYLVTDRFIRANKIILMDMIKQIDKGFEIKDAYDIATFGRSMSKITQLPAKATANQAWDFIAHYEIDQNNLFQILLNQAIEEIHDQGRAVWMIQSEEKVTLTTKKVDGAIEVTHINQVTKIITGVR